MAGHWYTQEGLPKYTVLDSKGKERETNLRDARKLRLVPSVTTILGVSAKPALINWLQNQILEAVLANQYKIPDPHDIEGIRSWKGMILERSQKVGKDAAKRGHEIHDALEKYLTGDPEWQKEEEFVIPAIKALEERFGKLQWVSEKSFTHRMGFGGKVDLFFKGEKRRIVLDFKTKDKESLDSVIQYDDHYLQTAAYREGLDIPDAECYNMFISTRTPGLIKTLPEVWNEEEEQETKRGWEMFQALFKFWVLQNKFNPAITEAV